MFLARAPVFSESLFFRYIECSGKSSFGGIPNAQEISRSTRDDDSAMGFYFRLCGSGNGPAFMWNLLESDTLRFQIISSKILSRVSKTNYTPFFLGFPPLSRFLLRFFRRSKGRCLNNRRLRVFARHPLLKGVSIR